MNSWGNLLNKQYSTKNKLKKTLYITRVADKINH